MTDVRFTTETAESTETFSLIAEHTESAEKR